MQWKLNLDLDVYMKCTATGVHWCAVAGQTAGTASMYPAEGARTASDSVEWIDIIQKAEPGTESSMSKLSSKAGFGPLT